MKKKMEKMYYKIFLKSQKGFYLFLAISILMIVIAFTQVKVDGIRLWLKIWQGQGKPGGYTLGDAIRFLKPYMHPYQKYFIAFYIGWLAETIIVVLIPKLFGIMLNQIIYQRDITEFFRVSGVVVFLSIYSCILYFWLYAKHHYLMIMFPFGIKIKVFEKFFQMRPVDLKKLKHGEIMAVIQEYPSECMHFVIRGMIHQANNFIIIAIVLLFSFKTHFIAGVLMIVLSGICSGITIFSGSRSKEASIAQKEQYGKYVSWLYEMIENFLSIRFLSMQKTVKTKFDRFSEEIFRQEDRIIDINQKWNDAQSRVGFIRKIQEFMEHPNEADNG